MALPSLFKPLSQLSSSTIESDFTRSGPSSLSSPLLWPDASSRAKLQVGGVLAATASVGFLEACLHFERRPVPLRFAVRYALYNILPSAVWKSMSAELVAAASGISTSALVTNSSSPSPPSQPRAKQLLILKSVRSVRHILGSYALAWSLYKAYSASSADEPGGCEETEPAGVFFERIVRLAPLDSSLSRVSRYKHGDHVTTLPLWSAGVSRKPHPSALTIDWDAHGLALTTTNSTSINSRVKMVEVELQDDEQSLKNARRVINKAVYGKYEHTQVLACLFVCVLLSVLTTVVCCMLLQICRMSDCRPWRCCQRRLFTRCPWLRLKALTCA